jgi:hypothetical protein
MTTPLFRPASRARARLTGIAGLILVLAVTLIPAAPAYAASWHPWASLGQPAMFNDVYGPAGAARATGHLDVLTQSVGTMYQKVWSPSTGWSGWVSLGRPSAAPLCGRPGAAVRTGGQLDVFGADCNSNVYHKWWSSSTGWSGWGSLGRPRAGCVGVGATGRASGALDVVVACAGTVYQKWWSSGTGWSGWGSLGAPASSVTAPAAAGRRTGELDILAVAPSGTVYQKWWSSSRGWSGWGSLGNPSTGGGSCRTVAAGVRTSNALDIVSSTCNNGTVYQKWWSSSSGWSAWGSLGDPSGYGGSGSAIVGRAGGQVDLLAEDVNGTVWHRWYG